MVRVTSLKQPVKQWIRLSSVVFFGTVGFVGCGKPAPNLVYVDVDLAVAQGLGPTVDVPRVTVPKLSIPGAKSTLPAVPRQVITTPPRDISTIRNLIRKQSEAERKMLESQLRALFAREAKRFEVELLRSFELDSEASLQQLGSQIRMAFEVYGNARMPKVARLAFLVGWPDPNPANEPPASDLKPVPKARFNEAAALRQELARLDLEFLQAVQELTASREAELADRRTKLLVAIEQKRDEMNRAAELEAERQMAAVVREFNLKLVGGAKIEFDRVEASEIEVGADHAMPEPVQVTSLTSAADPAFVRPEVEADLKIWLGLNGFTLARNGTDRTKEFIEWRRSLNP